MRKKKKRQRNPLGIYINSANRWDGLKTHLQFPEAWKRFTYFVVPFKQYKKYAFLEEEGWKVIRLPKEVPNFLSSQRQWVMDNTKHRYVWMMDDDLNFMWRDINLKLKRSEEANMFDMYEELTEHLLDIPLVGISTRLGNNRVEEDFTDITRVTRCFAINVESFHDISCNLAPFEPFLKQDFHLCLQFLKAGLPNRVMYNFAQGDSGSNAKGGCSKYRDLELMSKIAHWFAKEHKPFVTVVKKVTKGSWEGFETNENGEVERDDVTVQWKKAYKYGQTKSNGIGRFF
jgi:hypothetical protein